MDNITARDSSNVPDSAINDLERHTSGDSESGYQTDRIIAGIAQYFRMEILTETGSICPLHQRVTDRFQELVGDWWSNDDLETLHRRAETDFCWAGETIKRATKKLSLDIAREYRDELEQPARLNGFVKEDAA